MLPLLCTIHSQAFLESLSDEDFEKHRSALAVKRSEKPKKLKEETNRYWREILTFEYHFDRGRVARHSGTCASLILHMSVLLVDFLFQTTWKLLTCRNYPRMM